MELLLGIWRHNLLSEFEHLNHWSSETLASETSKDNPDECVKISKEIFTHCMSRDKYI
jgi:hypothetical protein